MRRLNLCVLGIHQQAWLPATESHQWLRVRRCVRCGRPLVNQRANR